jgi:hypothetical protein
MRIHITLNEGLIEGALAQVLSDNVGVSYENLDRFTKWACETYVYTNASLGEDIEEQLPFVEWSLGCAILTMLPDRDDLRLAWFRHNHRNNLLTLEQATHLIQMGRELWVCNYNADDELDLFTTVSIDEWDEEFGESLTEWLRDMKSWAM